MPFQNFSGLSNWATKAFPMSLPRSTTLSSQRFLMATVLLLCLCLSSVVSSLSINTHPNFNWYDSIKTSTKVEALTAANRSQNFPSPGNPLGKVSREPEDPYKKPFLVTAVISSCLLVVLAVFGFKIISDRSRIIKYHDFAGQMIMNEVNLRSFTYRQLYEATGGFREVLGEDSSGFVFRGTLIGDSEIAVKRLDDRVLEGGEREFRTEMNVIGRTHHKNLFRLLGYCDEGSHRLLVYEFMSNGSLAKLLFKEERKPNWEDRVRISVEIARGLWYLHDKCETQIIHCNIKPQNILLNDSWTAKISDFGLAKLLKPYQTRTFTGARGTTGYVAPEWTRNLPITVKVDVYSYGVMLLEIICCRKSLMVDVSESEIVLSDWVYECLRNGSFEKLVVHAGVENDFEKMILQRMLMVALWCVQEDPTVRPSMSTVVFMLEGTMDVPFPPHPTLRVLTNHEV